MTIDWLPIFGIEPTLRKESQLGLYLLSTLSSESNWHWTLSQFFVGAPKCTLLVFALVANALPTLKRDRDQYEKVILLYLLGTLQLPSSLFLIITSSRSPLPWLEGRWRILSKLDWRISNPCSRSTQSCQCLAQANPHWDPSWPLSLGSPWEASEHSKDLPKPLADITSKLLSGLST